MIFRFVLCWLLLAPITIFASEARLSFYAPFNGNLNAETAKGNGHGKFGKPEAPQYAPGVSGLGLVTGDSNENVIFDAPGNISSEQWTITFWMKGLPGAVWNGGPYLQTFWELNGGDAFMWFYRYTDHGQPRLFSQHGKNDAKFLLVPQAAEEEWHYWAVSWRKKTGSYLYLDGRLVGRSDCEPPASIKTIAIGQRENPSVQNKIIDEFKIYDAALSPGDIALRHRQEGNVVTQPMLAVSPVSRKIAVDGKIDPNEWRNAAGFSGLIDTQNWRLQDAGPWGKIAYDKQHLYLALYSLNSKSSGQAVGSRKTGSLFFQFMPDTTSKVVYTMAIGAGNTITSTVTTAAGKTTRWLSGATIKARSAAGAWSMEAAIPLQSLASAGIAPNASWGLNWGRSGKDNPDRCELWAPGRSSETQLPNEPPRMGTLLFPNRVAAVAALQQLRIDSSGRVTAKLAISNPNPSPQNVVVTLSVADKVVRQIKRTLQPSAKQTVDLSADLEGANGALATVKVQAAGQDIFSQSVPLILNQVTGQLVLWQYPSLNQIRLGWEVQSVANPSDLKLEAHLKGSDGRVLQNLSVAKLTAINGSLLADTKSLAPGKYVIEAELRDSRDLLLKQSLPYEKKPLPTWFGNTLGLSDTPPAPWTNIEVDRDEDSLSIWGRTYSYAGRLFPAQITNQGKAMLAEPMQLTVAVNGDLAQSSADGKANVHWTKTAATRADSRRQQSVGDVDVIANSYVEFDGMNWTNLTVTPKHKGASLKGLTLRIPLKAEWAQLLKPYNDYLMQQTGALPKAGWRGKALAMPWVGNGDGGLQFLLETSAKWVGSKSIEIIPDANGAVSLLAHFVDTPAIFDEPLQLSFGWMVSPVKAAPKNQRDWRLLPEWRPYRARDAMAEPNGIGAYFREAKRLNPNINFLLPWWQGWWWLPETGFTGNYDATGMVPVPSGNDRKNAVTEYAGNKFYGTLYGRLSEMGTANPWFEQFGDEWVTETSKYLPNAAVSPVYQATAVSQESASLRDFYAWGYDKLLNEGDAHALYFDLSTAMSDSNIYHGAGTVLPDGSVEPIRNILGVRRTLQRIYTLLKAKHPDGKIFYHLSGELMLPIESFADALVDGENYAFLLNRSENRGYEKILSVDQFRTQFSGQNNRGPASVMIPQFERMGTVKAEEWAGLGYGYADYLMGLVFLHDSNIWWESLPDEYWTKVFGAFEATGRNAGWSFIPYWNQKAISLPEGVYASIYNSPDAKKAVIVVMNTSGKDQTIDLPLSLEKGVYQTAKAVYPDQPVSVQNGSIKALHLANNGFRAVLMER